MEKTAHLPRYGTVPGEYGGLTDVARVLNADSDGRLSISRQNVYMWWRRRATNGFPEKHRVVNKNGREKDVFRFDEVRDWYASYTPGTGGRKPRRR